MKFCCACLYLTFSWLLFSQAVAAQAATAPPLAAPITYPTGSNPQSITRGDWDGDGDIDLATCCATSASAANVTVLYNSGAGTYSSVSTFTALGGDHIEAADMTNDGFTDLIVGDFSGTTNFGVSCIRVFVNSGTGTFTSANAAIINLWLSNDLRRFSVADLNGDGKRDVVAVDTDTDDVQIFMNAFPTGGLAGMFPTALQTSFSAAVAPPLNGAHPSTNPTEVIACDINNDGKKDLVYTTPNASPNPSIAYALNTTASGAALATFGPQTSLGQTMNAPIGLAAADFDQNGTNDIVCIGNPAGTDEVGVYLNAGNGTFTRYEYLAMSALTEVVPADVDGDGDFDLVLSINTSAANSGAVMINDGQGNFCTNYPCAPTSATIPNGILTFSTGTYGSAQSCAVGDFDGNGVVDFAFALDASQDLVAIRINQSPAVIAYPGSGEDFRLGSKVNTPGTPFIAPQFGAVAQVENGVPGQTISLKMESPNGTFNAHPIVLVAQLFTTGAIPPGSLPGLHVNNFGAVVLVDGTVPGPLGLQPILTPGGLTYSFAIPYGALFLNHSIMFQALALGVPATNGFFAISAGRELRL